MFSFSLQTDLWERGKNRLTMTSHQIKAALSPTHESDYDPALAAQSSSYYGEISSDEDEVVPSANGSTDDLKKDSASATA